MRSPVSLAQPSGARDMDFAGHRRRGPPEGRPRRVGLFQGSGAERARFGLILAALLFCLIGGGASRWDAMSLLYLRPALVLCIAGTLLTSASFDLQGLLIPIALLGAWAGLTVMQLIPLPPGLWRSLPGHARFAFGLIDAGSASPWRPLSLTPMLTWNSLLALLPPLAVLISAASLRRDHLQFLLHVLIGFACLSALLGLAQLGGGPGSALYLYRVTTPGSAVGFFANRNHEAALLAMTFPLLRAWTLLPSGEALPQRARNWVAIGAGLLFASMVLVTGSRAGLVLAAIGLAGAVLLAPPSGNFRGGAPAGAQRRRLIFIGLGCTLAIALIVVFSSGRAVSIQRLAAVADYDSSERVANMPTMLHMTRLFAPTGTGFGSFDAVFRSFEPDQSLDPEYFNHAHNDYVETALTGGYAGALLLVLFAAWFLRQGVVAFRHFQDCSAPSLLARAGWFVILIAALSSIVDYPLRTPLMAAIFALATVWLARAPVDGGL